MQLHRCRLAEGFISPLQLLLLLLLLLGLCLHFLLFGSQLLLLVQGRMAAADGPRVIRRPPAGI
jgi:hypothetical protein